MGNQIIKQPNGFYAIFSSNTDTIILWDCTEDDVMEYFAKRAAADARRVVQAQIGHVKDGHPREAYFQFALTWEEALEMDREHGGSVKVDYAHDDNTLARWTCGCDPTLTGLLDASATTGNIDVTVGSTSPRPTCGWPADNARRGPCGQSGAVMVMVDTFDEPPLAALNPGDEKPSILVLCAKHGQGLGEVT